MRVDSLWTVHHHCRATSMIHQVKNEVAQISSLICKACWQFCCVSIYEKQHPHNILCSWDYSLGVYAENLHQARSDREESHTRLIMQCKITSPFRDLLLHTRLGNTNRKHAACLLAVGSKSKPLLFIALVIHSARKGCSQHTNICRRWFQCHVLWHATHSWVQFTSFGKNDSEQWDVDRKYA